MDRGKPTPRAYHVLGACPHGQGAAVSRLAGPTPSGSAARDVRRHASPAPVGAPPDVRVAPRAGLTVELGVRGARVDAAAVAHHLDPDVFFAEVRDLGRLVAAPDGRGPVG